VVAVDWKRGDFLGTLAQGKQAGWRAHTKDARLDHGHGKYQLGDAGIQFHRAHGGETFIPYALINKLELTKRFSGKYTVGNFISKVTWVYEGNTYESGFVFAKNDAQNAEIHKKIRQAANQLR
jgi:hypothetical protein